MNNNKHIFNLTVVAMMNALAMVIYMVFPEVPLVPGVDYLKIDFSDIPAILCSISLGPVQGMIVEVGKNILHLFITTTFGIGELMNIGIGSAAIFSMWMFMKLFAKVFSCDRLSPKVYYAASVCAVACTVIAGWLLNAALTPIYFHLAGIPITTSSIMAGVWGSTLLNTVKAAFNLLPFYPVYFSVNRFFTKFLIDK